ncbi:agamous-like MADS-box protein AGL62 [Vitis vinifera]|uniref:Agamous-like MADS-box protein 62 n=3 Tax=Vitis vinifera TaxID=29760 RepID=D7T3N4_VITVI|eukprot:XP_002271109.1 PREDICTED: agamous-like MADS-box protein AGL62 [Vitis vinifera]
MATVRKSKGRQRVEMAKMTKESNLQVTFSKRRSGLFKKASELCTLCGVEIAIVVFSPGKKVYSFGHPCVESIIDRFLTRNPLPNSSALQLFEAHRSANVRDLNLQLTQVLNQLEIEKKRGEALTQMRKASQAQCWWAASIEELSFERLELLKVSLENLKKNVALQVDKLMIEASNPPTFFPSNSVGAVVPYDSQVAGFGPRSYDFGYGGGRLF